MFTKFSKERVANYAAELDESDWEDMDQQDARDVYYPVPLPGEPEIGLVLRIAFEKEGYCVSRFEQVETHPVLVVRAVRRSANKIADQRLLRRHFQSLLRQAGFRLRRDEVVVNRCGDRIMVALQWQRSPVSTAPRADELKEQYDPIP